MKPALPVTSQRRGRSPSSRIADSIAVIARVLQPPDGDGMRVERTRRELALDVDDDAIALELVREIGHRPLLEPAMRDRGDDRRGTRQVVPRGEADAVLVQRLVGVRHRIVHVHVAP